MASMKITTPKSWDEAVIDPKLDELYAKMARAKKRFYALSVQIQKRERKTYATSDKLLAKHYEKLSRDRIMGHRL